MTPRKRIMVDMSATLVHPGHIRLIKQASLHGKVIIGLTSDAEIRQTKGYQPELDFSQRREVLEAITEVEEVVATPWLIDESVLDTHSIDLLVHGEDNSNEISAQRLLVLPRTPGISSSEIRSRARVALNALANRRLLLTPGPAGMPVENLERLGPVFGRGDDYYQAVEKRVLEWLKSISGQQEIIRLQGSATLAIEIGLRTFIGGRVLLVDTGYYSDRMLRLMNTSCRIDRVSYEQLDSLQGSYDWIVCCYVETSRGIKLDLPELRQHADRLQARLFLDATASIGLESHHELADVMAFSSCKGLFGLTGAAFLAYKSQIQPRAQNREPALPYYFDIEVHRQGGVTGPYHAICSLDAVRENHDALLARVRNSKHRALALWPELTGPVAEQALLCTHLRARVEALDEDVVLYTPRSDLPGSVICHMGELENDQVLFDRRIAVTPL
jgi:cytidyltransferase-like protein